MSVESLFKQYGALKGHEPLKKDHRLISTKEHISIKDMRNSEVRTVP